MLNSYITNFYYICFILIYKVCLNQSRVKHAALNTKKHKKIASLKEDVPSSSSKIYEYSSLETKNEDNRDNFYDINTQTLDSNDSRDSGSIASMFQIKPLFKKC